MQFPAKTGPHLPLDKLPKSLACNIERKKISQWMSREDMTQFSWGGLEMFPFLQRTLWDQGAVRNSSFGTVAIRSTTRNSLKLLQHSLLLQSRRTCTGYELQVMEGEICLPFCSEGEQTPREIPQWRKESILGLWWCT